MDNLYGVKLDHVPNGPVSASDQNKRGKLLNAQLNLGALGSLGAGVVFGWNVTLDAGVVTVSAGQGIVYAEEFGFVAMGTDTAETVDEVPETLPYHVFAQALIAESPNDPDSRLTLLPQFIAQEGEVLDGALLLARRNEDGTLDDLREPGLRMRLDQVEDDLGYDETERAKGTVAERLNQLSGDGAVFWQLLPRTNLDPTSIEDFIDEVLTERLDEMRAELTDLIEAGGDRESEAPTDIVWEWLLCIRRIVGKISPSLLRFMPGGGAEPGLHGTASAPDTIQYDRGGTLPEVTEEREWDSR